MHNTNLFIAILLIASGCSKFHFCPFGTSSAGDRSVKYCVKDGADGQKVKQGPEFLYDPAGKLRRTQKYEDGKVQGLATIYHENGAVRGKLNYVDGFPEGKYEGFTPKGAKFEEFTYKKGNIISGKAHFPDGKVQRTIETDEKGVMTDKGFFPDGSVAEVRTMDANGNGEQIEYYLTGKKMSVAKIRNGSLDGSVMEFYEFGGKKREIAAKDGRFEGPVKLWHANGKPEMMGQHHNDQRSGNWIYTDSESKKTKIEEYQGKSQFPAAVTLYNPNATKKLRAEFDDTQILKTRIEYDAKGKQVAVFHCDNGKITKAEPENVISQVERELASSPKCHFEDPVKVTP